MTVYANGLEISAKKQGNKIIAATPDTCMTPPENPATPPGVPVPYPSFGTDGDLTNGTSTVKIGGETVSQKNLSYYSKTTGTEAGCAAKKGVVTSTNTGKAYAAAWSNNVKAEGEPVARFSDRATVNHASPVPNDGNGILVGGGDAGEGGDEVDCDALINEIERDLTDNKRVKRAQEGTKKKRKGGTHGYLFALAEQRCGEEPPGSDGWNNHEENLKRAHANVKEKIDRFMANCNLDDYEFGKGGRKGAQRDDNLKEAINGIHEGDERFEPQTTHLGEDHEACADLDAMRADETLNSVMNVINS